MICSRCGRKRGIVDAINADIGSDTYTCRNCEAALNEEHQARENELQERIRNILVTTGFDFAGHQTIRHVGIVRGIVVRSRSVLGTVGASLQTIVGGDISLFTQLCEKTRNDAFQAMLMQAAALDANAVLGLRYDSIEVAPGVAEVLAYGTAVVVTQ